LTKTGKKTGTSKDLGHTAAFGAGGRWKKMKESGKGEIPERNHKKDKRIRESANLEKKKAIPFERSRCEKEGGKGG